MESTQTKTQKAVLSVSQLTRNIKSTLEGSFDRVSVRGEVSNCRPAASGHIYFSLKDSDATISIALFRGVASKLKNVRLKDGVEIICHGRISVYPPRGSYQLIVEHIETVGAGNLQAAFEALKKKLHAEGLFAQERKKALPKMPQKIAVITSPTGAAIRDVLSVLGRRFAGVQVLVVPSLVQGEGAEPELVRAVKTVNRHKLADVILLTRGGGSLEDLWCFNSEKLARAIAASKIPVVSAVGHEIDFTIADFVADLRAPTPSAAAEILVSEKVHLQEKIDELESRLARVMYQTVEKTRLRLNSIASRLKNPRDRVFELRFRFDDWSERLIIAVQQNVRHKLQLVSELGTSLKPAMQKSLQNRVHQIKNIETSLNALSPLKVLDRGYSLVYSDDTLLKSSEGVNTGDSVRIRFAKGSMTASVTETGN